MSEDFEVSESFSYEFKIDSKITESPINLTITNKDYVPNAFFINTKEIINFQWIIALMTSYSRYINLGKNRCQRIKLFVQIIEDMKETFDPNGRYYTEGKNSQEVNSVIHHFGLIFEKHLEDNILHNPKFREFLKRTRQEKKWTLRQLSKETGLSLKVLDRIFRVCKTRGCKNIPVSKELCGKCYNEQSNKIPK